VDDTADMNDEAPRSESCIEAVIPEIDYLIPHGGFADRVVIVADVIVDEEVNTRSLRGLSYTRSEV